MMSLFACIILPILFLLPVNGFSQVYTPGISAYTDIAFGYGGWHTFGFGFTVNDINGINVTALGYYDRWQDGIFNDHQIGIWNSSGILLTSNTLKAWEGYLINDFRYVNLTSNFHLSYGSDYYIGAIPSGLDGFVHVVDVVTDPSITFLGSFYGVMDIIAPSPELVFPNINFPHASDVILTNFLKESQVIPEPSMVVLFISGFLGLLNFKWLRKRFFK